MLGIDAGGIEFVNDVDPAFEVDADSDQLFRVLTNLARNAVQAIAADTQSAGRQAARHFGGAHRQRQPHLRSPTPGPACRSKARENLFAAFRGSARSGGTGLGLAIAHELVRAHGGSIELVESVGGRTVFAVTIPDQPVRLDEARGRSASPGLTSARRLVGRQRFHRARLAFLRFGR